MANSIVEQIRTLALPTEKLYKAKILVTGANGLIASNLVEALASLSENLGLKTELYALCRNRAKAEERFCTLVGTNSFHLLVQNVTEPLQTETVFDYIFHAASPASPNAFNTSPVDVMCANFIGTRNLLERCRGERTRLLFVSSSEVYGENSEGIEQFDETMNGSVDCTGFRACYPESKRAAETLCVCYKKQYGTDVVIVRPAFIFGRQIVDSNTRADAYFLRQALRHEDIVMYSEGSQVRSYCYVDDCVTGILTAALKGTCGEVYNIGNDECVVTLRQYAQMLAEAGGVRVLYRPEERPEKTTFLKTTRCVLNADKLKGLGWKCFYSLENGIRDVFNK